MDRVMSMEITENITQSNYRSKYAFMFRTDKMCEYSGVLQAPYVKLQHI